MARKRKSKAKLTSIREGGLDLPDPASDEFAHLVGSLAWYEGVTANKIVSRLGLPSEPRFLMQVKRGLKRAHGKFLHFAPLISDELQDELDEQLNEGGVKPISFYVVDDTYTLGSGPVFAKVAEVASKMIADIVLNASTLKQSKSRSKHDPTDYSNRDLIVCNAGGRTLSEMVVALQRSPPVLDENDEKQRTTKAERLLFVAGNAAYLPWQFHHSANYLSVTMSRLFGADHFALPAVLNEDLEQDHKDFVSRAKLFICGAGTCSSGESPGLMMVHLRKQGMKIPQQAVGDLSFNLLDAFGEPVELSDRARRYMARLNPTITLEMLRRIAANNRVLLVLEAPEPEQKEKIAVAALRGRYATDVVLGARLARRVLETLRKSPRRAS